jgi:hypothetical protein
MKTLTMKDYFDLGCKHIKDFKYEGMNEFDYLVLVTAYENLLKKQKSLPDEYRDLIIKDLADFWFWTPEKSLDIINKYENIM